MMATRTVFWYSVLLLLSTTEVVRLAQSQDSFCDDCASYAQSAEGCSCEHCYGIDRSPGFPGKPLRTMPGDVDRGDSPSLRYQWNDCKRAGNPHSVAPWARSSVNGKYSAWFVGGGAAFAKVPSLKHPLLGRGRERKANGNGQHGEGTWGLDYNGFLKRGNVWLKYTQGRRQGGEGAYATDGEPKFIANAKALFH